jgi:alpha-tubulin suppressor-like RCC1 family protein
MNPMRTVQLDGFSAIALGGIPAYAVFLDGAGQRYGYGDNSTYQLGDGTTTAYAMLTPIGTTTYSAISTRGDARFVCAIRSADMHVECWGDARFGKTGSVPGPTTVPTEVMELSACTAVATGADHACAVCDGAIKCWGDNRFGQLGAPPSDDVTSIPRTIETPLSGDPWVQLVAGAHFTCARSESGRVFCWGTSERGALGNGGTGANLPVTVLASQID